MDARARTTTTSRAQATEQNSGGLVARIRRLPVISWIWPERHSAEAGAGCGAVGGACCAGGAVVKGLGLASAASVSSFVADATPFFIGASLVLMLGWVFWLFRQLKFKVKPFARTLARQAVIMGGIYAVVLGATMGIARIAGVSM
jgi:hypothetical protein